MLIEYKRKKAIVIGFFIRTGKGKNLARIMDIKTQKEDWVDFDKISILDGRLPAKTSISRTKSRDGKDFTIDIGIDESFTDKDFYDKLEDGEPFTSKIYYDYLDSITDLHNLSRIPHPEVIIQKELTSEQKRLKKIEDELNEGLKLLEQDNK